MKKFPNLIGMIFNRPQLAAPELMFEAVNFAKNHLGMIIANDPIPRMALATSDDDGDEADESTDDDSGIAQIGIYGPLVPRLGDVDWCRQMTSYESVGAKIDAAVADPEITHIVLDINSPGGAATGAFELADKIRAANAIKPISAIVHYSAYSGGYLLAAAAGEISLSQSSGVGSIGVIAQHFDVSKMNEQMGVTVTTVYRGSHKADLNPNEPLSDSSMQTLNSMLDRTYDQFTGYVAKFRGLPVQAVKATEAGLYFGQDAVDAGLADRFETAQEAINRIAQAAQVARAAKLTPANAFVNASGQKMRLTAAAMDVKNSL
ncbi:MAG TPA: S49 family peptidase [Noviherbaspirillum sp.]|nr:S49 family peptidase [Noviherbaspirillum sp.]